MSVRECFMCVCERWLLDDFGVIADCIVGGGAERVGAKCGRALGNKIDDIS